MDCFYAAIEKIRKRPGIFLGQKSITAFSHFIGGYSMALSDLQVPVAAKLLPLPFEMFHYYTANYYGVGKTPKGWSTLILAACDNDEAGALDTFWNIYDAFREIEIKEGQRCTFDKENIEYHYNNPVVYRSVGGDRQPVFYSDPLEAYIFELSAPAGFICVIHDEKGFELQQDIYPRKEEWRLRLRSVFGPLNWEKIEWNERLANTIQITG